MPMPPAINPYDPRKKQKPEGQPPAQPTAPTTVTTQPAQQQPSQAVQSSLPSMQPQKKPAAPVTYQQQAGAVADPRFSQALAQKLQSDVAVKTAALQQQQAQFQEELNKASGGVPAQERIGSLLSKITSGQASEAELAEYDKLQKMQYQGPMGLQGDANIAALSQLAGSPELLAQQYAGFAPGGVRPGDFAKAMAGLQMSPELSSAQQAATGLAQKAMSAEEIAAQQAALLKSQTEAVKTQAETAVKAEEQKMLGELSEGQKAELERKKAAFDKIKEGLFLTGQVSKSDLKKIGLDPNDPQVANTLNNLLGLNTSVIGGIADPSIGFGSSKAPQDLKTLESRINDLKRRQIEEGLELTPEQQATISIYDQIQGLQRDTTEGSAINYAKKEDLARINALRKLRGQELIKEEDVGKAGEFGKLSQSDLSGLIGKLKEGSTYADTKSIEKMRSVDNTLNDYYNKILTGGAKAGQYINDLQTFAKNNPDNEHAAYVAKRLERFKDIWGGWDAKLVKDFAEAQKKEVSKRVGEYHKQLGQRSTPTRKIKLTD